MQTTHSLNPDGVVLNDCTRRTEENNASILKCIEIGFCQWRSKFDTHRRIVDSIISHETVLATHTDAVRPLLEQIRAAGPNVVVLHGGIVAGEGAFGDVEAGPTPRIEGMNVFDKLVRVAATHLNISASTSRWRAKPSPVYLLGCAEHALTTFPGDSAQRLRT